MSATLCLSGDLHLRFSRFISTKQSWIWSICKAVHSSVRGCSFQYFLTLWPHRCTQFSCPAIYAEQQLLVDWSFHHNAMHVICCQKAQRPFSYQLSTTCPIYFRLFFQAFRSSQVSGCGRQALYSPESMGIRCFWRRTLYSLTWAANCFCYVRHVLRIKSALLLHAGVFVRFNEMILS